MTNPYPLPRELRETATIAGDGRASYGPFSFRIWDVADVVATVKRAGELWAEEVVTAQKVSSTPFDLFTVTFSPALASGDEAIVQSRRLQDRSIDVTRGGAISGAALERELSVIGTVVQELRRDCDRALTFGPSLPAPSLLPRPRAGFALVGNDAGTGFVNSNLPITGGGGGLEIEDIDGLPAALDLKADLFDPEFTGFPTATTRLPGNRSTAIATTAFVGSVVDPVADFALGVDAELDAFKATKAQASGLASLGADGLLLAAQRWPTPGLIDRSLGISVKDTAFGAKGDGSTDDADAINLCFATAVADKRSALLPAGQFRVTKKLIMDRSAQSDEITQGRPWITGEGAVNTRLIGAPGDYDLFELRGSTNGAGVHSYQTISGILFNKQDLLKGTVLLSDLAFVSMRDCFIRGGLRGLQMTDVLTSTFEKIIVRGANEGIRAEKGDFSHPNAMTFIGCEVGLCATYGVALYSPGVVTWIGGAIEGNGTTPGAGGQFGMYVANPGAEGALGVVVSGCYFEGNCGTADLHIDNGAQQVANIVDASFNRLSSTRYATNQIRMDGGSQKQKLNMRSAFKSFNDYFPSAGRPAVAVSGACAISDDNFYCNDAEIPVYNRPAQSAMTRDLVVATINGGGAVNNNYANQGIASVSLSSTGIYDIAYNRTMGTRNNIQVTPLGAVGSAVVFADNSSGCQIRTINGSGAAANIGFCLRATPAGADRSEPM